jgi:hypothetical protein
MCSWRGTIDRAASQNSACIERTKEACMKDVRRGGRAAGRRSRRRRAFRIAYPGQQVHMKELKPWSPHKYVRFFYRSMMDRSIHLYSTHHGRKAIQAYNGHGLVAHTHALGRTCPHVLAVWALLSYNARLRPSLKKYCVHKTRSLFKLG